MLDAVIGAVIMVVATTSLVSALEVLEQSFVDSARHPLTQSEVQILERVGLDNQEDRDQFYADNLQNLPKEVQ